MDGDQPKALELESSDGEHRSEEEAKPTKSACHGVTDPRTTAHAKFQQRDKSKPTVEMPHGRRGRTLLRAKA